MDWTRTQNYGVVGYQSDFSLDANTVEPVGAYNGKISSIAGQTPITLNSGASFTVVGNDAVWTNNGANLQQPITLVYKVKLHNRWNVAEFSQTQNEVEQLIYIIVNPTNN